jgi:hypothetical protein
MKSLTLSHKIFVFMRDRSSSCSITGRCATCYCNTSCSNTDRHAIIIRVIVIQIVMQQVVVRLVVMLHPVVDRVVVMHIVIERVVVM